MFSNGHFCTLLLGSLFLALNLTCLQAAEADSSVLPRPPKPFEGRLEPTEQDSTAVYPTALKAPDGAPNILLVMTDDVGFASASTFGGSVPTPNLDKLAKQGLRYNQFHTTGVCSPTRAALLTGRNHHAVGASTVSELSSPYPGYTSRIPRSAATVARVLRDNGYNTAMFGKDHNVPGAHRSAAGPFDQWPTGRGFEYFYGFLANPNQWQPTLYKGTSPVDGSNRPQGYLLDKELADRAMEWIHNQKAAAPEKPFFIYYAPGSAHSPHHAPKDWIARFQGKFDHGWDREREIILSRQKSMGIVPPNTVLAPRPEQIPAWNSLSEIEKRIFPRFMEVYAAVLAYQDAQFGRIMDELERMGIADNTLVVFIEGDNGSSGEGGSTGTLNELASISSPDDGHNLDLQWLEDNLDILGGPDTYQNYSVGWAYATNTPFPWVKQLASHLGGVRNGLVVSWPGEIKQTGELRSQYHHVIDVMPTLLEASGVKAPVTVDGIEQQSIDGTSMVYSFDAAKAPSTRRTQYYELYGNRAIYHEGWLASTTPRKMPWNISRAGAGSDITTYPWELYDLRSDFSQARNLAAKYPKHLKEMQAIFDTEARANNVYPIHDSGGRERAMRMAQVEGEHGSSRSKYVYWGRNVQLPMSSMPPIFRMPFSIEAEIDIPEQGGRGVIVAAGSYFGGWSFYLHEGKPVAYAAVSPLLLSDMQSRVEGSEPLETGLHRLLFDFDVVGEGGTMSISVDGVRVAKDKIAKRPLRLAGSGETFDTGRDTNAPVSLDYQRGGRFNGEIQKVQVNIKMPMMSQPGEGANDH